MGVTPRAHGPNALGSEAGANGVVHRAISGGTAKFTSEKCDKESGPQPKEGS